MAALKLRAQFILITVLIIFGVLQKIHAQESHFYDDKLFFEHGIDTVDPSSERPVTLPFNVTYFGSSYRELFITKDGLIAFEPGTAYRDGVIWSEGNFKESIDKPFVAPFYYDGYESYTGTENVGHIYIRKIIREDLEPQDPLYSDNLRLLRYLDEYIPTTVVNAPHQGTFFTELVIVVTWDGVIDDSCTEQDKNTCPSARFQAVIVADRQNTFVIFNYERMDIPPKASYQAGFNGGHRRGWFNVIPCQEKCETSLNSTLIKDLPYLKGSDKIGRFILNVGREVIIRGGCLPAETQAGTLEIYPTQVGMYGGELLQVSAKCLDKSARIYCRFSFDEGPGIPMTTFKETTGQMVTEMKGFCAVPPLHWKGPTKVSWSHDSINWSAHRWITVVNPSQADMPVTVPDSVKKQWMSKDAESITVMWSPSSFTLGSGAEVDINLVGYIEDEDTKQVFYEVAQNIGHTQNSYGTYTFNVADFRCKTDCLKYQFGLLEVSLRPELHAQANDRVALRFGPIPFGWFMNEEMVKEVGEDWSNERCRAWYHKESEDNHWLTTLPPCPCELNQALADFGRYEPDPSCNMYKGSQCLHNKGVKHCVISTWPTKTGAANQCCYMNDGSLSYSQLSYEGSTPDRVSIFGARPYGKAGLVPSLSHWKNDVLSYHQCCTWSNYELCDLYMKLRPTPDCKTYEAPGLAFIRGDPHITTFNGQTYQFGGRGDYQLVILKDLEIQGRFEEPLPNHGGKTRHSSRLSRIAIRSKDVPDVLVWPAPKGVLHTRGLDVLVNHERFFFFDDIAMDLEFQGGLRIINNAPSAQMNNHDNFTIFLPNEVGVNVACVNGLLYATVSLPPNMKTSTPMGMLGTFDNNEWNDYKSRTGGTVSVDEGNREVYNFAKSWEVRDRRPSLFIDGIAVEDTYQPIFDYEDIPDNYQNAPTESRINSVCQGNENCKWDYKMTGNQDVARGTKNADGYFNYLQQSARKVKNCGIPEVGEFAKMNNYNFSIGEQIRVMGCEHGRYFDGEATYTCIREQLDVAKEHERDDYGDKDMDEDNTGNTEYITHWVPRPSITCSTEDSDAEAEIAMIIGIVIAAVCVVIIIAIIIGVVVYRKKKTGSGRPQAKPRHTEVRDAPASEAMLNEKRTYSDEPGVHGSHV